MPAFTAEIEFAMPGNFALVESHSQRDQILNSFRRFGDDCPDDLFVTQSRARSERIALVQLERIFVSGHAADSALRPSRVRVRPSPFRNDSDRTVFCRFQSKAEPGNSAADNDEIVFLHGKEILSIKRVFPK